MTSPDAYLLTAANYRESVEKQPAEEEDLQARRLDTATLFESYERQLAEKHAVDFNDLLVKTIDLLTRGIASIDSYRRSIKHVIVDEYQDVNRASARLVAEIAREAESAWVVGDENQSIYGFMGASTVNLTEFHMDFPGAVKIPLGENHRSYQEITDAFYEHSVGAPNGRPAKKLVAKKGRSGVNPRLVACLDDRDEFNILAMQIDESRGTGISYRSQAVLVPTHARAAAVAQALEKRGIPVLYLGSIYERAEIKELLCLLQLSIDKSGSYIGGDWPTEELRVPYPDAHALRNTLLEGKEHAVSWWEADRSALSREGQSALSRLEELTRPIRDLTAPWEAVCTILFEDGRYVRALYSNPSQSAANARMAVWQFAHSCRTPDGLAEYPTVKNLFDRIRRRIRLKQDRNLRHLPPEADALDAVRVLTLHQSKGLEFDAVFLLDTLLAGKSNQSRWPLIPDGLLRGLDGPDSDVAGLTERHNLIYVGLSRARAQLSVYCRVDSQVPVAFERSFERVRPSAGVFSAEGQIDAVTAAATSQATIDELIRCKNGCPRQVEFARRIGYVPGGSLPLHKIVEVSARRLLQGMTNNVTAREGAVIETAIDSELHVWSLLDHPHRDQVAGRMRSLAAVAARLCADGGVFNKNLILRIASLEVSVDVTQTIENARDSTHRIVRVRESWAEELRQPLGALATTHKNITGHSIRFEAISLAEGISLAPSKVRPKTIDDYVAASEALARGAFEARPSPYRCPTCSFFMMCDQGRN